MITLLLLIASSLLAHGAFLLARHQLKVVQAATDVMRATSAASNAVRGVAVSLGAADRTAIPVGGTWEGPSVSSGRETWAGRAHRLSREFWLVAGEGRSGVVRQSAARIVWSLDPVRRGLATRAVVVSGNLSGAGVVEGGTWADGGGEGTGHACGGPLAREWSDVAPRSVPAWAHDTLAMGGMDTPLGLLDRSDLAARLRELHGSGTPLPTSDDRVCREGDPWNWGDPLGPDGPCRAWTVAIYGAGDLRMKGGVGQGVLVVDGDVVLERGATFLGVVVATGSVHVRGDSVVRGLVRSSDRVSVEAGSRVVGSGCAVIRALSRTLDRLGVLIDAPGSGWVGPA